MKIRLMSGNEPIDLDWLNEALKDVFNGKDVPTVMWVPDTYCSDNVVVVSSDKLTGQEVQMVYDVLSGDTASYNTAVEINLLEVQVVAERVHAQRKAATEQRENLRRSALQKLSQAEREALNV